MKTNQIKFKKVYPERIYPESYRGSREVYPERLVLSGIEGSRRVYPDSSRVQSREHSRGVYLERSRKAFTLIEVLIVIGIITLITGTSIAIIGPVRLKKEVDNTAERTKSMIVEARSYAMSPRASSFGLQEVSVRFYQKSAKCNAEVQIWEKKNPEATSLQPDSQVSSMAEIVPSVTFSNAVNLSQFSFDDPHCSGDTRYYWQLQFSANPAERGKVIGTSTTATINVSDLSGTGHTKKVEINTTSGEVKITN